MKPPRRPPTDEEIDLLLARQYRETSPAFEARWRELKRTLRAAPAPRRRGWAGWWLAGGIGALGAAAVLAILLLPWRLAPPPAPARPAAMELLSLDDALARAQPLLDDETRAALLHLPVAGPNPN